MKIKNITLIGMAGAGKSVVGKKLAEELEWEFVDTDKLMEEERGKRLQDILSEKGDEGFKRLESEKVEKLADVKNTVVAPGGSIVYSQKAMKILKNISTVVYLSADISLIKKRIDPLSRGIVGLKGNNFRELYLEREALYKKFADIVIDTTDKGISSIVKEIFGKLDIFPSASDVGMEAEKIFMKNSKKEIIAIPSERIISRIFLIRGKKVMLDKDLAELYVVKAIVFRQAVKRNIKRFPSDFMFQLNKEESKLLVSQNVIPSMKYFGGHLPYVFTEQGVAMLSSVLKSDRAIQMNIQIIRTFTQLRELLSTNKDLKEKIENMEKKYDKQLREIFEVIKCLLTEEIKPKNQIGFAR